MGDFPKPEESPKVCPHSAVLAVICNIMGCTPKHNGGIGVLDMVAGGIQIETEGSSKSDG
jgi:hypothetical protein